MLFNQNLLIEDLPGEVWKSVSGYEGLYEISTKGRVKSLRRYAIRRNSMRSFIPERIIKASINQKGYLYVSLHKDGQSKKRKVHRLVAEAFISNPFNKPQIDHIDTDRTNNVVTNLRWATPGENQNNPYSRKTHSDIQSRQEVIERCMAGREKNNRRTRRRPVAQIDGHGSLMEIYQSMAAAARETGVKTNMISAACSKKIRLAGGYRWEYLESINVPVLDSATCPARS